MRFIICFIAFFISYSLQAQVPELATPKQPGVVLLSRLDIDVKIMGSRAITTYTLTFQNTTDRILEGELRLPLPEGISVNRYALDINGKMREAVPVEKQKATQVFESIERRKVDPGLLEKTEGNVFRTRVYPLPASGERSIIIGYEQELVLNNKQQLIYHLPFAYKQSIKNFSLNVAAGTIIKPVIESVPIQPFTFNQQNDRFLGSVRKENFTATNSLTIAFTKSSEQPEVYVQQQNGQNYFYVQTFIPSSNKNKPAPKKLTIIWDVSLSGLYRNIDQEITLLKQYLQQYPQTTVELFTINNTYKKIGSYANTSNQAKALLDTIRSLKYDGGTNFSKIQLPNADEHLFFTDGFNALSTADLSSAPSPVYTITSATKADHATLHSIAQKTGGVFINLLQKDTPSALEQLTKQPLRFLGIKKNKTVEQIYPSIPVAIGNTFSMAGITSADHNSITMQFGYGNKIAVEKTVSLNLNEYDSPDWNLAKLWAQKKITELEMAYEANKDLITQLGNEHSIVTKNTSLIVLEEVSDYVRYRIEPPAELAAEYKQLIQEEKDEITEIQHNNMESAIEYSEELWNWWNTRFPLEKKLLSKPEILTDSHIEVITQSGVKDEGVATPVTEDETSTIKKEIAFSEVQVTTEITRSDNLQEVVVTGLSGRVAGVSVTSNPNANIRLRGAVSTNNNTPLYIVDGNLTTTLPDQNDIETLEVLNAKMAVQLYGAKAINGAILITTKGAAQKSTHDTTTGREPLITIYEKESQKAYLKLLSKAVPTQRFTTYLELRDKNLLNPTFYYEVASFFIKQNDKTTGLQILTNLAELDLENHELYKTFGYKLKELNQLDIAEHITRKVVQWRPQEPQSYRDHALILLERGKYQAALDTLYLAISKDYHDDIMDNYAGLEETIIMELNNLITQHKDQLNTKAINKKLIHAMPVDVRVVLSWNMNDTDIDLWITDPKGEKCYYSNNQTAIGGRLSDDFTDGYGPEQFLLKKAVKGKYKIQVHFYGQNNLKIAGKTTLQADIFTNYGRPNQQRKLITLQLGEEEKDGIYVGSFNF